MRYIKKFTKKVGQYNADGVFEGEETSYIIQYSGYQRGTTWFKNNGWLQYEGVLPVSRLDIVDGVIVELPEPEPTEQWIDTESFINALYILLPSESISSIIGDSNMLKDAIAGLALLSSNAAPGEINILDSRVGHWLSLVNLTIEQVLDVINNGGN